MLKTNYHTHTIRCGHASGEDEEFILEAIALGFTELGFTDHIMLPDHSQIGIRGDYSLLDDYIDSLNKLKEKYKEKITIHIGFEAEAMKHYFPYYKSLLSSKRIQYLILGNHCEIVNGQLKWFFSHATSKKDVIRYTKSLVKGIKTGMFKFVAHPDYYMGSYLKWDKTAKRCAKKICRVAKRKKVALEYNFGSIRSGMKILGDEYRFSYPYDNFWKIAKKYKCKIILGLDCHRPQDFTHPNNDLGYQKVKELDLQPLQKLDI